MSKMLGIIFGLILLIITMFNGLNYVNKQVREDVEHIPEVEIEAGDLDETISVQEPFEPIAIEEDDGLVIEIPEGQGFVGQ